MHYIFSFRSRNQSMRFYEALRREGIYSKIISTPRSVSVGCGLSVEVSTENIGAAKRVFNSSNYDTFIGLFYISANGVQRIY